MSIPVLVVAACITVFVVWLTQQGHVPTPINWIVWVILVVMWLVVLLNLMGFGGLNLGRVG